MTKTLVGTPDPKNPKITRVRWLLTDDWTGEDRAWSAWVAKPAVQAFVGTLQFVGASEIEVDDV